MTKRSTLLVGTAAMIIAGFFMLKFMLLVGLSLIAGSWFVLDNLWLLPSHQPIPWNKIIFKVSFLAAVGLFGDVILRL